MPDFKKHLQTNQVTTVSKELITNMVEKALEEDFFSGDITSSVVSDDKIVLAKIFSNQKMVLCGCEWVNEVFFQFDSCIEIYWLKKDGDQINVKEIICKILGRAKSILACERVALNFLQTLSSVSTETRKYVDLVSGYSNVKILDTRKTIPGYRIAQKYAVFCGGGINHRLGLFDGILIKENHLLSSDYSIQEIIKKFRINFPNNLIEIEVENFNELRQAIFAKADLIMLDNFSIENIRKAVKFVDKLSPNNERRPQLEVSGGASLESVKRVIKTGVDYVSVGSLTKNISAVDLTMRFFL